MKTTREQDLDILTDRSDKGMADAEHVRAIRDQVYEQAKDTFLEAKRKELQSWIVKGLDTYEKNKDKMNLKAKEIMATCEMQINRIEREIKAYTSSSQFQEKLIKAAVKVSQREATVYLKKTEGTLV